MTLNTYAERDADRAIILKSDDDGVTWYPDVTGAIGATGPQGPPGADGAAGAAGATGPAGPTGPTGPTGGTGAAGTNGTNGTNGAAGSPGTILLASGAPSTSAGSFTNVSLIGGPLTVLGANTIAVGDVLEMNASGNFTSTGTPGAATVVADFALNGTMSNQQVTVSLANGTGRVWTFRLRVVCTAIGSSQRSFSVVDGLYLCGAAGSTNQIVLASSYYGQGVCFSASFNTTTSMTWDVIATSSVNSANVGASCRGYSLTRIPH